jgi:hypothetical protein
VDFLALYRPTIIIFFAQKIDCTTYFRYNKSGAKNSLNEEVNRYWEIGEIQSLVNSISWSILYEHEAPICVRIGAATIMRHQRIKYLFKSNESFSLIRSLSKKLLTRAPTSEETQWANRCLSIESSHFEEKDGNIHYIKTLQDFVDKKQKIEEGEYRIVHISEWFPKMGDL